jgi:ketosteroid isomerase-like protein
MALSPVELAVSFIDHVNRRDLGGLCALMSPDHRLEVFDEAPVAGKEANAEAWRGYFDSFPRYVIYPHKITERAGTVAILGHTTGSHLGLSDDEERQLTLIWLAETSDGMVTGWKLVEDNDFHRHAWRLD